MSTPLSVVGGFLGAGKTTLLNHVLRHAGGTRYAVLVNDFGEIALDDRLIVDHGGDTVSFANGCVCCSLGDSLLDTVDRLLDASEPPDQFIVEASGVADPTAIGDLATLHPNLRRDLIIVLCDAVTIRERAADERLADTVQRQLEAADVLVLNHCDQLTAAVRDETLAWLEQRSGRPVIATTRARVDLTLLEASPSAQQHTDRPSHDHHSLPHPFHTRVVRGRLTVSHAELTKRLQGLGQDVLRAKGLLLEHATEDRWWLAQMVADRVEITPAPRHAALDGESALVLLGTREMPSAEELARVLGLSDEVSQA